MEHASHGRPFAFASSPRQFERDRPFHIDHIALDLTLDVPNKRVSGTAIINIHRVDAVAREIAFDAIAFDIHEVKIGNSRTPYTYDGRSITVPIAYEMTEAKISIAYTATPRRGLYFLEPDEHVQDRPRQVWSQCQEEDARHFIPCHDKPHVKMTTEIAVTVPHGWYALSNGELVEKSMPSDPNLEWRFHWKMNEPVPSYLITLVAGEFVEIEAHVKLASRDVPLQYLVPKGREIDGKRTFLRTPDMIAHFSDVTGVDYPWNKYAQVVVSDFIFGGMENTTATTMYEHILLDERAAIDVTSDDLISHELAHQWFGDYVTCRDWSEAWLNEGFATYMEHVWREKHLGKDEYDFGVKGDLAAYVSEAHGRYRRAIVCNDYDSPLDLFDRHLYEKGGLVLHLLRTELGSDVFWRGVNSYLVKNARGIVETRDLMRALEDASGKSLGRIFDQFVYKPGHPELEVTIAWEREVLRVTVRQTQAATDGVPAAFDFPLFIDVVDAGGTKRERVNVTQKNETFAIPCAKRPEFVVVDPDLRVIGETSLKAPNDMLRAQLAKGRNARARWVAAQALAHSDDATTIAALGGRLEDENEFWGVRAESAEALGQIRAREGFDVLVKNVTTKHPKVRRAIVDALGRFRTPAAAEAIRARALRDDSYMVEAEAARALGKTKQASALETLLDVIDRPSWADAIRAGAIDGLAALRDERATPHVLARTRYGQPTRARRSAIMAIPKLASDRKGREALEDLLDDPDPHLRIDVVRALLEMGDVKARSALRARLDVDLDARVRRRLREALRDLGGDSKKNLDQLREEFGKLESEHADLKSRIALIEARTSKAKTDSDPKVSEKAAKKAEIAKPAKKTKSKAASKSKAKKGK